MIGLCPIGIVRNSMDASDCNDGNMCTDDLCQENSCVNALNLDCCDIDDDCNDGDPCTFDLCIAGGSECLNLPGACP